MPTHPHNKAPTADRLVAGGGFSLDVAQRQDTFARQDTLYIGITDRSARRFVRQRPKCAPFVDARQLVGRHSSRRSAKSVRKTPTFSRKAPRFSPRLADGLAPTAGAQGKNFTSPRRKCAEMHMRSLFLFLLAFYAGKTRYICTENLFYQLRMAKSRRFVAPFVCPAECSHTFHPSL